MDINLIITNKTITDNNEIWGDDCNCSDLDIIYFVWIGFILLIMINNFKVEM